MSSYKYDSSSSCDSAERTDNLAEAIFWYHNLIAKIDKNLRINYNIRNDLGQAYNAYQQMFAKWEQKHWPKSKIEHYLQQSESLNIWIHENLADQKKLKAIRKKAFSVYVDNLLQLLNKLSAEEFEEVIDRLMELRKSRGRSKTKGQVNCKQMDSAFSPKKTRVRRNSI